MNASRFATGALAGLLALTLAACGTAEDDTSAGVSAPAGLPDETTPDDTADQEATSSAPDDSGDVAATTSDSTSDSTGGTAAADQLEQLEAVIAAAEDEAGGTAYEIDDQDDDESWEVDVAVDDRSVEVTVGPDGQVVRTEEDDLDEDDRDALAAATITIVDAAGTALGEVEGTLDDIELDEDNGTFAWEVTIDTVDQDDVEVYVDVATGEVLRVERD